MIQPDKLYFFSSLSAFLSFKQTHSVVKKNEWCVTEGKFRSFVWLVCLFKDPDKSCRKRAYKGAAFFLCERFVSLTCTFWVYGDFHALL